MKVFVFGAGASLGSQPLSAYKSDSRRRSPLVNDLFNKVYAPCALPFLTSVDLAQCRDGVSTSSSLEQWLTERWDRTTSRANPLVQEAERNFFGMVTFYIWQLLREVSETYTEENLYAELLRKIYREDEEFSLLSFNYDTLLDRAFDRNFFPLNTSHDYDRARLIKPHGSVNWYVRGRRSDNVAIHELSSLDIYAREAAAHMFQGDSIDSRAPFVLNPFHRSTVKYGDVLNHPAQGAGRIHYPLVLVPLTTKLYPLLGGFYNKAVTDARHWISNADDVYLIGYRANDDIIKEMCRTLRVGVRLHVVSTTPDSAARIMADVRSWQPTFHEGDAMGGGFETFVENYGKI